MDATGSSLGAAKIELAIMHVTSTKLETMAAGRMGCGTNDAGDLVVEALQG